MLGGTQKFAWRLWKCGFAKPDFKLLFFLLVCPLASLKITYAAPIDYSTQSAPLDQVSSKSNISLKERSQSLNWKNSYRSFYYETAGDLGDVVLDQKSVALLIIDMQNKFAKRLPKDLLSVAEQREWDRWIPFYERIQNVVVPNLNKTLSYFRQHHMEVIFTKTACLTQDGRDRSLTQKRPGWNYSLLPLNAKEAEIIDELYPLPDEIIVSKTTDSALTGTNLRLILHNMGIKQVIVTGIVTDQCVSSTVRNLADESYEVVVLEDCCAAATNELHEWELKIINNIYCNVMSSDDVIRILNKKQLFFS